MTQPPPVRDSDVPDPADLPSDRGELETAPDLQHDPQSGPRPAIGYVCVPGDEDQINGLHHRLDVQAAHAGLDLVEVFVDRQTPDDDTFRPGLALAVEEIARQPDAVLLVPDLSHLPTSRDEWAAWEERFTTMVTEIHTLDTAAVSAQTSCLRSVTTLERSGGEAQRVRVGRARLTAPGQFEVTVRPDDEVASVIGVLRQLPSDARFLESYGDVDTTLVFAPIPIPGWPTSRERFVHATATGSLGEKVVGFTTDDIAAELRAVLAGVALGPDDERVVAWLSAQTAERALAVSSLLRRVRAA
jgi:uncharacterized repeat protein (TIGR03917 family)